jgi:hypothetical protein
MTGAAGLAGAVALKLGRAVEARPTSSWGVPRWGAVMTTADAHAAVSSPARRARMSLEVSPLLDTSELQDQ